MTSPVIVCVDDDADVARTVARRLRREHMHLLSTTEPEEALAWVLANDVAVLLCDYQMPVMNGVELASRVRDVRPATVRILLTGSLDITTAMASINIGEVFRFVAKPIDSQALVSAVRQGVDYHRELAAVAGEREHVLRRARTSAELEAQFPTLTTPARAHDGAYLVERREPPQVAWLGLDSLLALRR